VKSGGPFFCRGADVPYREGSGRALAANFMEKISGFMVDYSDKGI
jgi:hypothetical protein